MTVRQLVFGFSGLRVEIPVAYVSWRDASGARQARVIYPHCVDYDWPWWRPEAW
jgi:hypothetical protein